MKVSIERADLSKAVGKAQSVVERRNTPQILGNVLISAEKNGTYLRATDLEIDIVDKVGAQAEHVGATTVSATMLNEIVRKLPEGALVQLACDDAKGRLTIRAGRSQFVLATLPKDDFSGNGVARIPGEFLDVRPNPAAPVRKVKIRRLY